MLSMLDNKALFIYLFISHLRMKLDYGYFSMAQLLLTHCNKINNLQMPRLESIIRTLKSTSYPAIEIEITCSPLNIRWRWKARKFLLKSLANIHHVIFYDFLVIYYSWHYVQKSLPILDVTVHSLALTRDYIIK